VEKISVSTFINFAALLLTSLLLTTACAPIDVYMEKDDKFDFSTLKTYSWIVNEQDEFTGVAVDKEILDKALVTDINKELESRGYRQSTENPDFLISYIVTIQGIRNVRQLHSYYGNMGYTTAYRGATSDRYGTNVYEDHYRAIEYTEGKLILDIINRSTKETVWRGVAQTPIGVYKSETKQRNRVTSIVEKVLRKFPAR